MKGYDFWGRNLHTFASLRRRRPFKRSKRFLHEHERQVILADAEEVGTRFTAADLMRLRPHRYDPHMLKLALRRMRRDGDLRRPRRSIWGGVSYEVTAIARERRAA